MSWTARYRTPRGTQPDTDPRYSAEGADDAWYEPHHRAPAWRGASEPPPSAPHPGRARAQEQLSEVADALERLMDPAAAGHDTAPQTAPNRQSRRAAAARARSAQRPAPAGDAGPNSVDDARTSRIEAVLGALDRLDRRVEDLSHTAHAQQVEDEEPARPVRHARQPSRFVPDYGPGGIDGYAPAAPSRGRHAPAYHDAAPAYDAYDADPRDLRASAAPQRSPIGDASELGEELRPLFNDLARRIDEANDPRDEALATMRRDIGDLRSALVDSLRAERNRPPARDSGEIRRLSEAVERMRTDRSDMRLSREMRAEISDLRALIGQSNVDGMLKSLESGYAHLVQRLDELARDRAEPRLLEDLGQRLMEIEDAFRVVPRADQLVALDDRVADIGHRVEELVRRSGGEDVAALRGEIRAVRELVERIDVQDLLGGIDERLSALSVRFDAIERLADGQRAIEGRLEAMETRAPQAGAVDRLNDRLEQIAGMLADDRAERAAAPDPRLEEHLGEIAGRLKRIENARQMPPSYDAAFTLLEKRLAAIDGKIDALDRPGTVTLNAGGNEASIEADLISRLEGGIARLNERMESAGAPAQGEDLSTLHQEIASLRDQLSAAPATAQLEAQLRDLSEAINRESPGDDGAALSLIEDKISALAEKLDAAEHGFSRLGDLQSLVSANGSAGGEVADALRGDLDRLLDAATSSERRTRESMDSVQDVMASINKRLMSLEVGAPGPVGGDMGAVEDDRPLEPGSGKPVSAQKPQMRLDPRSQSAAVPVRESHPRQPAAHASAQPVAQARPQAQRTADPSDVQGDPRDRKADFIAAARRAAQAAAAEVQEQKSPRSLLGGKSRDEAATDGGKTATAAGWLRSRLPGKRKAADASAPSVEAPVEAASGKDRRDGPRSRHGKADMPPTAAPELRAEGRPGEPDPQDLSETKGKGSLFSSGGRRAVLLAAAAVVIAIGALQIFKQVSPTSGDVAGLDAPAAIEQPVDEPGAQQPVQQASTTSQSERAAPAAETSVSSPEQSPPATSSATAPGGSDAGAGRAETAPADSGDMPNMAFAPPANVQNGFSAEPGSIPATQFQRPASMSGLDAGARPEGDRSAPVAEAGGDALAAIPQDVGPLSLRQAAAAGDPKALFAIAARYTEGTGVTPDLQKAASYYEKASQAGLAPAQYRLGSLYEKGRGVTRDLSAARDWYALAAKQGNAKASHNLAVLYAEGISGNPEFRDAAFWFKKAANFGLADSQYNLGILYARGLGLEKNLVESYKWFALAAAQGDGDAANKRDELANMLSKEQLAEARLAVANWKEAPRSAVANEVDLKPSWSAPADSVSRAAYSGDPRDMVMMAQKLLAKRGFDPGAPDGQIGTRTRDAVRAFEKASGLPVTGKVSADLLKALSGQSI
ncbi:peptidoglycan-binding protein [Stappia sp. ES.058]|uniref:peptidoglycan-binding protein n=1 Tax=Stappia sp. ES.058 TaxID=1881061 RepID=UPI00087A7B21|nr:peptidoglycan-binding protein [Stappia sp. ES.058]SDT94060.1 localization factor PodJL [Stappia sp. ES.058]